jgi:small subunit ribosomal protein S21
MRRLRHNRAANFAKESTFCRGHVDLRAPFCYLAAPQGNGFRSWPLQIIVRDNNIDQALKALKKKMQREGIFREMKLRGHYEKPSEKRARERAEAIRRYRKLQRKRMQREGLLPR